MTFESREPAANTARSHARELPLPQQWHNEAARLVYEFLSRPGTSVDMYLVEPNPPRLSENERRCYGDDPNVIAFRLWGVPLPLDNAETYIARHIALARQRLGGVPLVDGVAVL